jgi:hypothetical protein
MKTATLGALLTLSTLPETALNGTSHAAVEPKPNEIRLRYEWVDDFAKSSTLPESHG